jgi:superfamily II DNA/RNA helicase
MFEGNPASKALVFSQYNSTLDWLQATLPSFGLSCRYINGSMTLNQRTKAIEVSGWGGGGGGAWVGGGGR